jgi:hypothetical protein
MDDILEIIKSLLEIAYIALSISQLLRNDKK